MIEPARPAVVVDLDLLAKMIRQRRGDRSHRELQIETGIDYSTLYRIESRVRPPSLCTFAQVCAWLEVSPVMFLPNTPATVAPPPEPPPTLCIASPQRPTEGALAGWAAHIDRLPMSSAKRWTRKLFAELQAERARYIAAEARGRGIPGWP